ncbi:MAG: tRNA 4-thiouridine(8) synthase ThiI [Oscillospiraceae bacterium]|nr:tRNA 4-thiouridine(8) synthase ThiI [Oscillospiraceae bacterium]
MKEILLLKLGELVLKGLNRGNFEKRLMKNINWRLRKFGDFKIYCLQSTIYVDPQSDDCDMDSAVEAIKKIFGIVNICRAAECEKDMEKIVEVAKEYLCDELSSARTFKVEAKRSDKSFPMKSPEIAFEVGGALHDAFENLEVDVKNPEVLVKVEVRDRAAYIHANPIPGAGGLPIGINGRAAILLSGGIDSPVAAYMMAKRGVELFGVHFFSYPYTSERAKEKVIELARLVGEYAGNIKIAMVPFTKIQEEIRAHCKEEYFTIIMRRFMMYIAEKVAEANDCGALITGESLGQVASQTMEALCVTENGINLPVLRPVIGMDKEEIVTIARRINTFETSILPYEDCCTVFTPKHPRTKPKLEYIIEEEKKLPFASLAAEAIANIEII